MLPAVEFFHQEQADELLHLVGGRGRVAVVWGELDVRQWEIADELVDGLVVIVFELGGRNRPDILAEGGQGRPIVQRRIIVYRPIMQRMA